MPMPIKLFFQYFWFISVLTGILNITIMKSRLKNHLVDRPEDSSSSERFVKGLYFSLVYPFLALGVLQLLGGFTSPFFAFSTNFNNIYILLSWAVLISLWGFVLYCIWLKDAAEIIVKYHNVLNSRSGGFPENLILTKVLITLMICGGILGLIIGTVMGIGNMPF